MRAAGQLIGVGYDNQATADALRVGLAAWIDDSVDRELPDVFGVRTVAVGWRRRRIGLIHYGSRVRHRTANLAEAVGVLNTLIGTMAYDPEPGEVALEARAFRRGDQAVLVLHQPVNELDETILTAANITEVPGWRAVVTTATGHFRDGSQSVPVVRILVTDANVERTIDAARRYLWARAAGDMDGWAQWLDTHGDQIRCLDHMHAMDSIIEALSP